MFSAFVSSHIMIRCCLIQFMSTPLQHTDSSLAFEFGVFVCTETCQLPECHGSESFLRCMMEEWGFTHIGSPVTISSDLQDPPRSLGLNSSSRDGEEGEITTYCIDNLTLAS